MRIACFEPVGGMDTDEKESLLAVGCNVNDPAAEIDRYVSGSTALGDSPTPDGSYSFCRPLPANTYEQVVFSKGCPLLNTAWTRAWILGAAGALKYNSQIILPRFRTGGNERVDRFSEKQAQCLLGRPTRESSKHMVFRKGCLQQRPASVMSWFQDRMEHIIGSMMRFRGIEENKPEWFSQWQQNHSTLPWVIDKRAPLHELTADFLDQTYEAIAIFLSYIVQTVNPKANVVRYIFSDLLSGTEPLRFADLGAGCGFLGAELILEGVPVAEAISIDKSLAYGMVALDLCATYKERLEGRYRFVTGRVEQMESVGQNLDAITMITSLCYVPEDRRWETVCNAWASLKPGGILAVYENLQAEKFTRDYKIMFTEDQLESFLSRLGAPILYYHPVAAMRISQAESRNKTCFRVLQKGYGQATAVINETAVRKR